MDFGSIIRGIDGNSLSSAGNVNSGAGESKARVRAEYLQAKRMLDIAEIRLGRARKMMAAALDAEAAVKNEKGRTSLEAREAVDVRLRATRNRENAGRETDRMKLALHQASEKLEALGESVPADAPERISKAGLKTGAKAQSFIQSHPKEFESYSQLIKSCKGINNAISFELYTEAHRFMMNSLLKRAQAEGVVVTEDTIKNVLDTLYGSAQHKNRMFLEKLFTLQARGVNAESFDVLHITNEAIKMRAQGLLRPEELVDYLLENIYCNDDAIGKVERNYETIVNKKRAHSQERAKKIKAKTKVGEFKELTMPEAGKPKKTTAARGKASKGVPSEIIVPRGSKVDLPNGAKDVDIKIIEGGKLRIKFRMPIIK